MIADKNSKSAKSRRVQVVVKFQLSPGKIYGVNDMTSTLANFLQLRVLDLLQSYVWCCIGRKVTLSSMVLI